MHSVRRAFAPASAIGQAIVAGAIACTSPPTRSAAVLPAASAPAPASLDVARLSEAEQITLGGAWRQVESPLGRDSVTTAPTNWYLTLSFHRDGQVRVAVGDEVDGSYRIAGREVTVVAAGDTSVARVSLGGPGDRMVPLRYEMRRDTLWWRGGGRAPVPLRAWVPALERERRLPAGAWYHAWPESDSDASLQLTAGGCARFNRSYGVLPRPYRVDGDTLSMGFGGFLGLPERSRFSIRGDTLQLDFTFAGRGTPQPLQLLFVRYEYDILDPAARCAPPPGDASA